jgi:hypothetical protein
MIPVLMYIPPQNKTVKEQASCRNKESVVREYSRNNGILGESISFSVKSKKGDNDALKWESRG